MNDQLLGKPWKQAHDINSESVEDANIPKICNKLDVWVGSDSIQVRKRLSLRTSVNLIYGVTKLCKAGVDELFEDVKKLEEDMIFYRKRRHSSHSLAETSPRSEETPEQTSKHTTIGSVAETSSRSEKTPEQTTKYTTIASVAETSSRPGETPDETTKSSSTGAGISTSSASPELMRANIFRESASSVTSTRKNEIRRTKSPILSSRHTMSRSANGSANKSRRLTSCQVDCQNGNCQSRTSPRNSVESLRKTRNSSQIDQAVKTTPISEDNHLVSGFDKTLPFAYVLIHDNYNSRIPSRILVSSLNKDVTKLN